MVSSTTLGQTSGVESHEVVTEPKCECAGGCEGGG